MFDVNGAALGRGEFGRLSSGSGGVLTGDLGRSPSDDIGMGAVDEWVD